MRISQIAGRPLRHVGVRRAIDQAPFRPLLALQPHLPFKYLRTNYLAANLDRARKSAILAGHYSFLSDTFAPASIGLLAETGIVLWRAADTAATHEIRLRLAHPVDYEGELALEYRFDEAPAYILAFSFAPGSCFGKEWPTLCLVSRVQALTGDVALLRRLAKELSEIAPRYSLAAALQGLALALNQGCIVAVSHANQVTTRSASRTLVDTNYDAFYASLSGGCEQRDGFFSLPVPFAEKDLSEVAATHRRRARRKRAIRQSIADEVERAAKAGILRAPAEAAVQDGLRFSRTDPPPSSAGASANRSRDAQASPSMSSMF